jgi:hypothetical protein
MHSQLFMWLIGGILLLILATQETRCVGKSGGNSPVFMWLLKLSANFSELYHHVVKFLIT